MKIKLFYFYDGASYIRDENRIEASSIDWRGDYQGDKVFIKELEIDIPDCEAPTKEDLASGMIANLKEEKNKILAETHKKISEIEDKIMQLSAITYQGD